MYLRKSIYPMILTVLLILNCSKSTDVTPNGYQNPNRDAGMIIGSVADEKGNPLTNVTISLYDNVSVPLSVDTIAVFEYALPQDSRVVLTVSDFLGNRLRTLVNEVHEAGYYTVRWAGKDSLGSTVPSGMYLFTLTLDDSLYFTKWTLLLRPENHSDYIRNKCPLYSKVLTTNEFSLENIPLGPITVEESITIENPYIITAKYDGYPKEEKEIILKAGQVSEVHFVMKIGEGSISEGFQNIAFALAEEDWGTIKYYLSDIFYHNGYGKLCFLGELLAFFDNYEAVEISYTNLDISIEGDSAFASFHLRITGERQDDGSDTRIVDDDMRDGWLNFWTKDADGWKLRGNHRDLQTEIMNFADEHWDETKYRDWYSFWDGWFEMYALDPFENVIAHQLPQEKNSDYYLMIGKYDQFLYGWDDIHDHLEPGDSTLSPLPEIVIWGEAGLDTVYFEPYIRDLESAHRKSHQELIFFSLW